MLINACKSVDNTASGNDSDFPRNGSDSCLVQELGESDHALGGKDWRGLLRAGRVRLGDGICCSPGPSLATHGYLQQQRPGQGLSEAWDAGALIVASNVKGLQGYVDGGRNCLTFEPGDDRGASEAIAALIKDESLRSDLRRTTSADIAQWTRRDYLSALRSHIEAAVCRHPSAPSRSSVAGINASSERGRQSR
jgi:hypothetical protein